MNKISTEVESLPIFICYRQADGKTAASFVYDILNGQLVEFTDPITGEISKKSLDVYFDQAAPASPDWESIHGPYLKLARTFILICSPGAKINEGEDDWVYNELNWWLEHGTSAPILIDPLGTEKSYIPDDIETRWPNAQRISIVTEEWLKLSKEELDEQKNQVRSRLLGGIASSAEHYLLKEMEQKAQQADRLKNSLERQRKTTRQLRFALVGAISLLIMFVAAAAYIFQQSHKLQDTITALEEETRQKENAFREANENALAAAKNAEEAKLNARLADDQKKIALQREKDANQAAELARNNERLAKQKTQELEAALALADARQAEILIESAENKIASGDRTNAAILLLEANRLRAKNGDDTAMRVRIMEALELPVREFTLPTDSEMHIGLDGIHISGPDWLKEAVGSIDGVIWHQDEIENIDLIPSPRVDEDIVDYDAGWETTCLARYEHTAQLMKEPPPQGVTCEAYKEFNLYRFSGWGSGGETQTPYLIDNEGNQISLEEKLELMFSRTFSSEANIVTWAGIRRTSLEEDSFDYDRKKELVAIYRDEIYVGHLYFDEESKKLDYLDAVATIKLPFNPDEAIFVPNGIIVVLSKENKFAFINTQKKPHNIGYSKLEHDKPIKFVDGIFSDNDGKCHIENNNSNISKSIYCFVDIEKNLIVLKNVKSIKNNRIDFQVDFFRGYFDKIYAFENWIFIPIGYGLLQIDLNKIWDGETTIDARPETSKNYDGVTFHRDSVADIAIVDNTSFLTAESDEAIRRVVVLNNGELRKEVVFRDEKPITSITATAVVGQYLYNTVSGLSEIGFKLFDINANMVIKDFGASYKGNFVNARVDEKGTVVFDDPEYSEGFRQFKLPKTEELASMLLGILPQHCKVPVGESWLTSSCSDL